MRNQRGVVVIGVMVIMCVMMMFGGMHISHGGTGPKEITDRWSRSTITMRTTRNTCITMLEGKILSPVRMKSRK